MKTELELRIALAKIQGWREPAERKNPLYSSTPKFDWNKSAAELRLEPEYWACGFPPGENMLKTLPELTLDWVHEIAVKHISEEEVKMGDGFYQSQHGMFNVQLERIVYRDTGNKEKCYFEILNATASQRAEAILKANNLWREE